MQRNLLEEYSEGFLANNRLENFYDELYGRHIEESFYGMVMYQIVGKECILTHAYIDPMYRNMGYGKNLVNEIIKKVSHKCTTLVCEVDTRSNTSDLSTVAIEKFGFEKLMESGPYVIYIKDIKNG